MIQHTADPDLASMQPTRTFRDFFQEHARVVLSHVPPSDADPRPDQQRPADPLAYPTGWLDEKGNFYRCHFLADEHERLALAWGPRVVPAAGGAWRQALERNGWRALRSDGTLAPQCSVTAGQVLMLTSFVLDGGEDLDPAYRAGLVRTLYQLAGKPLASDAPLPEKLPLPPLLSLGEAIQRCPSVSGWLAPDGRLYICERYMHGRFAAVLAHVHNITGSARLESWQWLERAGWAHLSDIGTLRCTYRLLTQAQLDTLGDLLADERLPADYRERVGQSLAREVEQLAWLEGGRR